MVVRSSSGLQVENVQLDGIKDGHFCSGKLYVLWANDIPVGEFYTGQRCSAGTVNAMLREARRAHQSILAYPAPICALPSTGTIVVDHSHRPLSDLERCLNSLCNQTRLPDQIIVLDRSADGVSTRSVTQKAGAEYLSATSLGACSAKNASLQMAGGEIIAFLDDGLVCHPNWLQNLLASFDSNEITAVAGLELPLSAGIEPYGQSARQVSRSFRRRDFSPEMLASVKRSRLPVWPFGTGSSVAFRRSTFDVVRFDEALDQQASDYAGMYDLWFRIALAGGTCRTEPTAATLREIKHVSRQIQTQVSDYVIVLRTSLHNMAAKGSRRQVGISLTSMYVRKLRSRLAGVTLSNFTVWDEVVGYIRGRLSRVSPRVSTAATLPSLGRFEPITEGYQNEPLISVVIPAYNAAATIDATLMSVRRQTHRFLEIVVVNDGSTDQTAEIVARHSRDDPRVTLVTQTNKGLAGARNRGIAVSHGELIAPVDADDLCHPEKFARQVAALRKAGSTCGLVYGWSVTIDQFDRIQGEAWPYLFEGYVVRQLLAHNFIGNGSSPLMTRAAVEKCGGYDPTLKEMGAQGCEDLKLYLSIAEHYDFAVVPVPLTGYRVTEGNFSSDIDKLIRSHRLVIEEYTRRYPEYRCDARDGHISLAAHCVVRAFNSRQFSRGLSALAKTILYAPAASTWVLSVFFLSHLRRSIVPRLRRRGSRQITSLTFPQDLER